jgi:hypothetical protein
MPRSPTRVHAALATSLRLEPIEDQPGRRGRSRAVNATELVPEEQAQRHEDAAGSSPPGIRTLNPERPPAVHQMSPASGGEGRSRRSSLPSSQTHVGRAFRSDFRLSPRRQRPCRGLVRPSGPEPDDAGSRARPPGSTQRSDRVLVDVTPRAVIRAQGVPGRLMVGRVGATMKAYCALRFHWESPG